MDNNNGEHKQRNSAPRGNRPTGKGGYRGGKPGSSKGNFRGSKPSGRGRGGKPVSLPRAKAVVALISRNVTDRAPSLVTIKTINPLKKTNADRSEALAMIGARGIVLPMVATRAAIVEVIATVVLISGLLMGAIVPNVVIRAETVRTGIAISLHEAKKALVRISVSLTGLPALIVVAWAAPKAWVIEPVKARRSALSLKRRLRVC